MRRSMPAGSQGRTGTFTEHRPSNGLRDILRGRGGVLPALSRIRSFAEQPVLIGYMRVSKADGSFRRHQVRFEMYTGKRRLRFPITVFLGMGPVIFRVECKRCLRVLL